MVAVVLAADLGVVIIKQPPSVIHPSTTTLTLTQTTITTSTSTQTVTQTLPAPCLGNDTSKGNLGALEAGTSSPAIICVQVYEFDANSSIVLNPTSLINITGFSPFSGRAVNGLSNFTIAASPNSVDLGGPTSANEGIVVALAITAKTGTSGTYFVELQQGMQQALYLETQGSGGERFGGGIGHIVAGTGQPDYTANVTTLAVALVCTSSFTIQGVPYDICPDIVYYRVTGETNSTR